MKYLLPFLAVWGVIYLGFISQQETGYTPEQVQAANEFTAVLLDPQANALMEIWNIDADEIDKKINLFGE